MTYSQRKNLMTKQDKVAMSKWAMQQPGAAEEAAKASQQRRDLWDAINRYVTERGGTITSKPYETPIRVEIRDPDSELPNKLAEAGYDLIEKCNEVRIGPPKPGEGSHSFQRVKVFHLRIPRGK